jgi:hypothetical protein
MVGRFVQVVRDPAGTDRREDRESRRVEVKGIIENRSALTLVNVIIGSTKQAKDGSRSYPRHVPPSTEVALGLAACIRYGMVPPRICSLADPFRREPCRCARVRHRDAAPSSSVRYVSEMADCLLQKVADMVVEQRVVNVSATATTLDQAQMAQQP